MKTRMIVWAMAACFTLACSAKDIKTVVLKTSPEMHCANCEKKIKSNIRFEKGVKEIETNLDEKTVTVKYDADKTTVENIIAGFSKIGYTAKAADACCGKKEAKTCTSSCCGKGEKQNCGSSCDEGKKPTE